MNMDEKKNIPEFVLKKMDDIMRLCHQTKVARIGLFGSALRKDFDPEKSDLDFVVEFFEPDAPGISDRYLTLAESLETIFEKRVDLITARSIRNPVFSAEVYTSLCPLYAA
jgi:predicted nucleotidyltransferase